MGTGRRQVTAACSPAPKGNVAGNLAKVVLRFHFQLKFKMTEFMAYLVSPECVSCEVEEGIAILDLRSNTYFRLDPVGAAI